MMKNRESKLLKITTLQEKDLEEIASIFHFPWLPREAAKKKWTSYYAEQKTGKRIACVAKWQEQFIGYGSLLKDSEYPPFKASQIPEIHDVWISADYRGHGFGKKLIFHLERMAQQDHYRYIGIGVGLYKDYGRAQKLYVQLGYVPDGEGATYQYQPAIPGNSYPLDDDLLIWLKKELPPSHKRIQNEKE